MASWLKHPRYVRIREGLVQHLRPPKYRFRRLNPVVFLCGADGSKGRDALRDYLHKYTPSLNVFYAERVWEIIANLGELDALQMEEDLAKLADLVIVIVESPGTFTELGAFSLSPSLRRKMLAIVDEKYQGDSSFISNGPIKWIDSESLFKPTIYTNLDKILLAADQAQERIQRIEKPRSTKLEDPATSPKHLLFFICDLVSVIYPATISMISGYLAEISPSVVTNGINVPTLVGLAVAMDLLRPVDVTDAHGTSTYYVPTESVDASHPFHHSRLLYLENQRAAYASVMLTIPEAKAVMEAANAAR
jgi:hypothetical protein